MGAGEVRATLRSGICAVGVLTLLACDSSEMRTPSVAAAPERAAVSALTHVPSAADVATLDGAPVPLADLVQYVSHKRGSGYRPFSSREAERLLRAYLRERILERETRRRGLPATAAGRSKALAEIADQYAGPRRVVTEVAHTRREVFGGDATSTLDGEALRSRVLADGSVLRRKALLDLLLNEADVKVDTDVLAGWVQPIEDTAGPASPPRF